MRKRVIFTVFMLILLLIELTSAFFINLSSSVPAGIYARKFWGGINQGDYVVYKPSGEARILGLERGYFESEKTMFLKKAALVGSGSYYIDPETRCFWIDDCYAGQSMQYDSNGRILPFRPGRHVITSDELLPVGTAAMSFDGRYTGPIKINEVLFAAVPVLLFDD